MVFNEQFLHTVVAKQVSAFIIVTSTFYLSSHKRFAAMKNVLTVLSDLFVTFQQTNCTTLGTRPVIMVLL